MITSVRQSERKRQLNMETLAKIKISSPARPVRIRNNWSDDYRLAWLSIVSMETASDMLNDRKGGSYLPAN